MGVLGLLGACVYAMTDGTANSRFLQVGATVGALVYLATLVDILLGLCFLVVCVGLSPEVSLAGLDQLRIEDFIVPPLALAWLLRSGRNAEPAPPLRLGGPSLALFALLVVSSLLGMAAGLTTIRKSLPILAKYVEYFLIFAIVAKNVRTEREFKALVGMVVAAGVAGVLFSGLSTGGVGRVAGTTGETANIYGGYLALILSIVLGLAIHASSAGARTLAIVVGLLLAAGTAKTLSRTTYAALALSTTAFALFRERRLIPWLLLAALAVPFLLPDDVGARVRSIGGVATGDAPSSWDARLWAWHLSLGSLSGVEYLWGRGAGSVSLGDVDNEYVRVMMDSGILGLAFFVWFLASAFRAANAHHGSLPGNGFHKGFAAGYLIAFGMLCIHGIGATSFTSIRTMEMFMILTGLMICQAGRAVEWGLIPPPAPVPSPASYPLILR